MFKKSLAATFQTRRIAAALLAMGAVSSLVACGDSGASQEELNQAKRAGAAHAREQTRIKQIQHELRKLRKGQGGAPAPSNGSSSGSGSGGSYSCGGELSVGPKTTCPFAENVKAAYFAQIGSGSGTVIAYSPARNRNYSMYCTAGTPHVCTGGEEASVYFP